MKILFIVPRYHTNLIYRVKALRQAGYKVKVLALRQENSESYEVLKPEIIGYGKLYELLSKLVSKYGSLSFKKKWKINWAIPNLKKLKREIKDYNPDFVFIRGQKSLFTVFSYIITRIFCSNIYLLVQTNKHYGETFKKKIALFFLKKIIKINLLTKKI